MLRDRVWTLQVVVAGVFIAILLAIAGSIVWYSHHQMTELVALEARDDFTRIAEDVRNGIGDELEPARIFLDTAALTIDTAAPIELLATQLPPLLIALKHVFPSAFALYIGRPDGSFVIVQSLASGVPPPLVGKLPDGAAYALQTITHRDGTRVARWTLFNEALQVVGQPDPYESQYDPRSRGWYQQALPSADTILTPVYAFTNVADIGVTMARRSQRGGGVFGLDVLLTDLDALLAASRAAPSMELFLFDSQGVLIAHPEGSKLRRPASNRSSDGLPHVADVDSPSLATLYRAYGDKGGGEFPVTIEGRRYLARFEPAGRVLREATIGMAYPFDEIVGPANRIRSRLLTVGLATTGAALLIVFLAARLISRPLRTLTADMTRMVRFDFTERPPPRSRVVEIRELARALATMKAALGTFARYVPSQLVRNLVANRLVPELGGQRQPLTLLFSDMSGFTAMAETLGPEELTAKTSRYFSAMGAAVLTTEGTIDKYIGDAMMVFWNAPTPQADHVRRACLGALRAAAAVEALNAAFAAEGTAPMPTRFGLHTGEAVIGNVGSIDRMNYTALGHTVNLAARIETLNKRFGTTILASEAVYRAAGPGFLFDFVGEVVPEGAREPLRLYELVGELDTVD